MPTIDHLELTVSDLPGTERFWCDGLGFWVTDRSEQRGDGEMVFLTSDAATHHQVVLRRSAAAPRPDDVVDHVAFRVASLDELQSRHRRATADGSTVETVSHGSSWSLYVAGPGGLRVEFYVDTPWKVAQPCRFEVDLTTDLDELRTHTHEQLVRLGKLDA